MQINQQKLATYLCKKWYSLAIPLMVLVGACFCISVVDVSALTTVPTKTNFQGRLTNSVGNIMPDGTYNMRFKLYTVSSGGSAVWSEDRLVSASQGVQLTNGLFSVRLGDVTPIPASLFASGSLYFEIELPTPGTATSASPSWTEGAMTPRNQLATSAYAYNSETLDGLDSAAFGQLATNNTWTGTNTINTASANAFDVQNGSSVSIFKVDTSTSAVTINADTTVAAGKSLTLVGGSSRPTGVEGRVFYDSSTKQLLTYANGKWQADRTDAILVASSTSSQADRDAADYVTDGDTAAAGDGDQVQINTALTAAAGRKVVLLAGTYVADATILVPNNTALAGVGAGTVIELADIDAPDNLVENSGNTGVVLRDLKLNGRKDLNSAVTQHGVYLSNMGDSASSTKGSTIINITATNFRNNGIHLDSSDNNAITNSTATANNNAGFYIDNGSVNNTVTGNLASGNANNGFTVLSSSNNTLTGNTASGNTSSGISISNSSSNTVTGNTSSGNTGNGVSAGGSSSNNTFTGNTVSSNTLSGFNISSSNNVVSSNTITDNTGSGGTSGITITSGDNNLVVGNRITDTAGTGYAINITNSASDTNYLANNYYSGTGASSINDVGTGTIFAGQVKDSSNGNLYIQPAGTIELVKNTNITGTLNISSNVDTDGSLTIGTANQFIISSAGVVTAGTWQGSEIQDAYISNTLTASIIQGTGSTTNAVDLGTAEVAGTLTVGNGGLGATTLTSGGVLYGNGSGAVQATAAGTSSQCLIGGATPTWGTCNLQSAYTTSTGSTTPEIKLDTTRGALDIQDADTTIGSSLLNIKTSNAAATLMSVSNTGATTFQNSSDSAAAFTISRAGAGGSLFVVDTTNSRIQVGNATADGTGVVLVLDNKNTAGDPTGVDGAMYYNSNLQAFRCYQGGEWLSCMGGLAASSTAAQTISGTTATDWTKQYTIPANNCVPGRVYRITARGTYTTGFTAGNITVSIIAGSTTIQSTSVAPGGSATNRQWILRYDIICQTSGASGTVEGAGTFERFTGAAASTSTEMLNTAAITLNTTTSQILKVRSQATQAATSVTIRQVIIESLGP